MSGSAVCYIELKYPVLNLNTLRTGLQLNVNAKKPWETPRFNAEKSPKNPGKVFYFFVQHPVVFLLPL